MHPLFQWILAVAAVWSGGLLILTTIIALSKKRRSIAARFRGLHRSGNQPTSAPES